MTKAKAIISWKDKEIEAFKSLKQKLCFAPILSHPDFTRFFTLYTDASKLGLGVILSQTDNKNEEHVICYAS